jgi:essential nuclear protein 1
VVLAASLAPANRPLVQLTHSYYDNTHTHPAVYKPAAFFKGILLPLCHDQGCSLREAAIVASVLQRVSIPVHHAAVAIHKLAQQNTYTGATSIFLRTLLNKKYSLPKVVVASLIHHFATFTDDPDRELPVLWHQALLVFVERYKTLIQSDPAAREALRRVMIVHYHPKITPEIRRELFGAVAAWKEEHHSASSTTTAAAAMAEDTMQVE